MTRRNRNLWAILGFPAALAVLSLTGLVGALLEDGVWDLAGAALLATCLVTILWARWIRRDRAGVSGKPAPSSAIDGAPRSVRD
jgi:cobalamin synthase